MQNNENPFDKTSKKDLFFPKIRDVYFFSTGNVENPVESVEECGGNYRLFHRKQKKEIKFNQMLIFYTNKKSMINKTQSYT